MGAKSIGALLSRLPGHGQKRNILSAWDLFANSVARSERKRVFEPHQTNRASSCAAVAAAGARLEVS